MTSRFYRKNAAKVRFQGAKGVKSSVLGSKRAQKGLKWGRPIPYHPRLFIDSNEVVERLYQNCLQYCRGHQKKL